MLPRLLCKMRKGSQFFEKFWETFFNTNSNVSPMISHKIPAPSPNHFPRVPAPMQPPTQPAVPSPTQGKARPPSNRSTGPKKFRTLCRPCPTQPNTHCLISAIPCCSQGCKNFLKMHVGVGHTASKAPVQNAQGTPVF
jgi:hypothetical protein